MFLNFCWNPDIEVKINKNKINVKMGIFPYPLIFTCILGAQKNRLIETVLLSTHNICFDQEIRKLNFNFQYFCGD